MILNSPYISGSLTVTNLSGSGVRYLMTSASGLLISQTADAAIKTTYTASSTAGQTVFPVTNGYSTGLVDVYLNGTKLASSDYSDADGLNITLVTGSDAGDLLEFVKYSPALGVTNNALRQLTTFTSSEGQTVYSASYTPGLLDVYYNGSRLTPAEYTANNGTYITLATGSTAGDVIDMLVYSYQVGAFSGVGGTGVANQIAYWDTTNSITGSPNFTVSGSTLAVTGSFTVITGSVAEFTVNPTGVRIGNVLTDSHVISGSLRVNPNGLFVSSSGIVGIGTSSPQGILDIQTVQDGVSGKNLRLAYNGTYYAEITEKSIRTYNNELIIGTGVSGSERMRITATGNVGIGNVSPLPWGGSFLGLTVGQTSVGCLPTTANAYFTNNLYYDGSSWRRSIAAPVGILQMNENIIIVQNAGTGTAGSAVTLVERLRVTDTGFTKITNDGNYYSVAASYHEMRNTSSDTTTRFSNTHNTTPYGISVYFTGADPNNITSYLFQGYSTTSATVLYTIYSNGTTAGRSDIRLKKNIEDATPKLDKLMQLRVVNYEWKESINGTKEIGLIAQEVEEVFPNLVITEPIIKKREVTQEDGTTIEEEYQDGDSKSIKHSVIPFMLLKALQEANAKITALEEKLERNNIQ